MASNDIISRIVLQAKGGDEVAQEIGKVKEAYLGVEKAGEEVSSLSLNTPNETTKAVSDLEKLKTAYSGLSSTFQDMFSKLSKAAEDATNTLLKQLQALKGSVSIYLKRLVHQLVL